MKDRKFKKNQKSKSKYIDPNSLKETEDSSKPYLKELAALAAILGTGATGAAILPNDRVYAAQTSVDAKSQIVGSVSESTQTDLSKQGHSKSDENGFRASNSVSMSDSLSNSVSMSESLSNSVSMSDSLSNSVSMSDSLSNSVSMSDSLSNLVSMSDSLSNLVSMSESLSNSVSMSESLSNSVSMSESLSNSVSMSDSLSNSVSMSDSLSNSSSMSESQSSSTRTITSTNSTNNNGSKATPNNSGAKSTISTNTLKSQHENAESVDKTVKRHHRRGELPQTGAESSSNLLGLMITALGGLLGFRRKKRKDEDKD